MHYFEDTFINIYQEDSIAVMEWLGLAKTDDYRLSHEKFLEMLQNEETPSSLWLFDYQNGKVIDIKDQNWTTSEWFPLVTELPNFILGKVAVLLSQDIFNKVAVRIIMTKIEQQSGAEVAYFEDRDEAIDWLKTPSESTELIEIEEEN